ncbi:MAG: aspartyl protease family protein [Paludibacter sp.]|nr:aspartyl protease family protein [Paludibacter sp.]
MRKFTFLVLCSLFLFACVAQSKNKIVASIPFEMVGSYVVIVVRINQSTPLKMILDTGVRNTILTELHRNDNISLTYSELRDLQGLGKGTGLNAYICYGNTLKAGKIELPDRTVMVLQDDIFNLSRLAGTEINGLLGSDFFNDHIIQIDYTTRRIKFYEQGNFRVPRAYGVMPMFIEKQKMFIQLSVLETDSAKRNIKMLIDTGAQLNAWFQTLTNKAINIPEKSIHGRIGEGLNGEITGYFARVPQICIANFCVINPIVAFPDSVAIAGIVQNTDRDGTIGSQLLSRFNLIIDTYNKLFYFKPNYNFNKAFLYNIAGIEIVNILFYVPQIEVINVWKNSPAEKAGIKTGDLITEINAESVFNFTLSQVRGFFERSSKKPMKMKIQRDGKMIHVEVDMKAKI